MWAIVQNLLSDFVTTCYIEHTPTGLVAGSSNQFHAQYWCGSYSAAVNHTAGSLSNMSYAQSQSQSHSWAA